MGAPAPTRRRILHGAGLGGVGLIAGCFDGDDHRDRGGDSDADGNDAAGEVHFLTDYYNDAWDALWDDLESGFEDETDIPLHIEESGTAGTDVRRLVQLIQAGDPPDANTSSFDQVAGLWEADRLEPVDDVVASIEGVNGEIAADAFLGEADGVYQIPHGLSVSTFQYRRDVYDALGLEEPETFSDVLENARVIDESDEFPDMRGYGLAGAPTGKSRDEFLVMAASAGIPGTGLRWRDPDAREELEIHWPEETVTEVLQYAEELADYSPDPTEIGWGTALDGWVRGQYGQCHHRTCWPAGVTARIAEARDSDGLRSVAENTRVAPYPMLDGVDPDENWLSSPPTDGYHVFANGDDPDRATEWFEWLYADSVERTARLYGAEPGRFLPAYDDVLESDAFRNRELFRAHPHLLEKLESVREEIAGDHYGSVDEADLSSPAALYVRRQQFYGGMLNRVVTDSMCVREAYDWGYKRLEESFADARERFGD